MKATGMTRKVDEMGRVALPIKLRRSLGIVDKDSMEIFVDGEKIILQKYHSQQACMITGNISDENISLIDGKIVLNPECVEIIIKELQQYLVK